MSRHTDWSKTHTHNRIWHGSRTSQPCHAMQERWKSVTSCMLQRWTTDQKLEFEERTSALLLRAMDILLSSHKKCCWIPTGFLQKAPKNQDWQVVFQRRGDRRQHAAYLRHGGIQGRHEIRCFFIQRQSCCHYQAFPLLLEVVWLL